MNWIDESPNDTCATPPLAFTNQTLSPTLTSTVLGLFSSRVTVTFASAHADPTAASANPIAARTTLHRPLMASSSPDDRSPYPASRPQPHRERAVIVG